MQDINVFLKVKVLVSSGHSSWFSLLFSDVSVRKKLHLCANNIDV